jgi:hypothetical protein
MSGVKDGGPAFPLSAHPEHGYGPSASVNSGMTLRAYAAIKLGVPDSGIDWLDDMIRKSVRDLFAGQALAMTAKMENPQGGYDSTAIAEWCYSMADAMMAERKEGGDK